MSRIPPVLRDQLDTDTLSLLKAISGKGDSRWNVFEGIAHHAPTLKAVSGLIDCVDDGLTTLEQEVLAIEIARFNGCGYCLPAHRFVCNEIGLEASDIDALTRGELLHHRPELELLQQFLRAALVQKGNLDDDQFSDFETRGIGSEKMIVILAEIALYTLLNYFNRLARSDIETAVLPFVSDEVDWITPPDR